MKDTCFILKQIFQGKSVLRSYLNLRLKNEEISGQVLDVGGGNDLKYLNFLSLKQGVEIVNFDLKSGAVVDFEKDNLPQESSSIDTILFLNVMEHIYNYNNILSEVIRVVKPGGKVIGFVPFLMWYHPDHKDYFRYTNDALEKILSNHNVTRYDVNFIGRGPFVAAAHMIMQSFPKFIRPFIFLAFFVPDIIFCRLRPSRRKVFALGYYFIIIK